MMGRLKDNNGSPEYQEALSAYNKAVGEAKLYERSAKTIGERLRQAYPNNIEYGEDRDSNPYIKWEQ